MVNIIISGANGKMGKVVANGVSAREDCQIVSGIDINTTRYDNFPIFSKPNLIEQKGDVIIDFSNPAVLDDLLDYAIKSQTPIVVATTGYNDEQIKKIKEASKKVAVFFSFNMSLGINLLIQLSKIATNILGEQFDIEIIEKHHNQKIDAPSGTAIMLADEINNAANSKYQYMYDRHSTRKKRSSNEIGIHSLRGGTIVGEHEVVFAGRDEIISLTHQATSKEIFAVGAIKAAIFLKNKSAGLYDMGMLIEEQNKK